MLNSEFPMPIRGSRSYELVGPRIGIGNSELSIGQISVLPCPTFGISASDAQLQIHYLAIRFWVIDSRHE